MKLLLALTAAIALTACAGPDALVINGASKHVLQTGKDHSNLGLGLRAGRCEAGYYDNSRNFKSHTVYGSCRMRETKHTFIDLGAAYYDDQRDYDAKIVPIVNAGVKVGPLEAGLAAPDILNARIVLPF